MTQEAQSILHPSVHARLIQDLDHVCEVANVPAIYVHQSAANWCGAAELGWVRNFKASRDRYAGMILVGSQNVEARCMALAGALLRNFLDARVVTLNQMIQAGDAGRMPDPTVLLMPNLYLDSFGKSLPAWKIQGVYDLLVSRMASGRPSVLGVETLDGLAKLYGVQFRDHLTANYYMVN